MNINSYIYKKKNSNIKIEDLFYDIFDTYPYQCIHYLFRLVEMDFLNLNFFEITRNI